MEKTADNDEENEEKSQVLSKYIDEENLALLALDGFLLVLSDEGDITYVSENISDILGLAKVRQSIEVIDRSL